MKIIRFLFVFLFFVPMSARIMVATKFHKVLTEANLAENKTWLALEKELFEKVTSRNQFILSHRVLIHHYTADKTEFLVLNTYADWASIEKAVLRNEELMQLAWPDRAQRESFLSRLNAFYQAEHSDEIYAEAEGAKIPAAKAETPMVWYLRTTYLNRPLAGLGKEFDELYAQFGTHVIQKNELMSCYLRYRHEYGSNSTEMLEFMVADSLCQVDAMLKRNDTLFAEHWDSPEKRKAFSGLSQRYFTQQHGDYFYLSVPALEK